MKTAREMFEDLGYKGTCVKGMTSYKKNIENFTIYIRFYMFAKTFEVVAESEKGTVYAYPLSMQELQAINQMCKELGWME